MKGMKILFLKIMHNKFMAGKQDVSSCDSRGLDFTVREVSSSSYHRSQTKEGNRAYNPSSLIHQNQSLHLPNIPQTLSIAFIVSVIALPSHPKHFGHKTQNHRNKLSVALKNSQHPSAPL